MPTYEYKCEACGHAFERFQPITAQPIKKCPECGKNQVRRLIGTGAGLIFKGSGFYITDYRDKAYSERAKSETAPAGDAKPAASADAKSDASPKTDTPAAPKAESKPAESKPASKGSGKAGKAREK